LSRIFWNQLAILGSTMGDMDEFRSVIALLGAGRLAPVIDQVVEAADGVNAFSQLEAGAQFGKIVLTWT
jgi:NADPH:quinone reductase-like Zn-dependent oxidoreductase